MLLYLKQPIPLNHPGLSATPPEEGNSGARRAEWLGNTREAQLTPHKRNVVWGALLIMLLLAGFTMHLPAQTQPTWSSLNDRGYPQWFRYEKLGIFIHWGLYSVPAYASK